MEIESTVWREEVKFRYSVKPKLTDEEIRHLQYAAIGFGIGEWVAEAIRQKLKEEHSGRE